MKKRVKVTAYFLAAVLMISGVAVCCDAEKAEAKKVRLNRTKLSMVVSQKYKLKLIGTKKNVKWTSGRKKVASVTKKGVVRAKAVGKTKITAKAGKKKNVCKVTVSANAPVNPTAKPKQSPAPTSTPATSNIKTIATTETASNIVTAVEIIPNSDYIIINVTNTNKKPVSMYKINYQFCNAEGTIVKTGNKSGYAIGAGDSQVLVEYLGATYTSQITLGKSVLSISDKENVNYVDVTSECTISHSKTLDGDIAITFVNGDSQTVSIDTSVVLYDESGKPVGARYTSRSLEPGKTEFDTVIVPFDEATHNKITYSTYKVFNHAYKYQS